MGIEGILPGAVHGFEKVNKSFAICRLADRHAAKRRGSVISLSPSYAAARFERYREPEATARKKEAKVGNRTMARTREKSATEFDPVTIA
jgi:hypothetical protein